MMSLKELQKLDLKLFNSNKINNKMRDVVYGGKTKGTTWKQINSSGDTLGSGSDSVSNDSGHAVTIYDNGTTKRGEGKLL